MAERIKNNEYVKSVFRYLDQKMTDRERYEFERTLELDPFLADAFEGISTLKSAEIDKDLRKIDFIKGKKVKNLSPAVYIAVAALFLGLIFAFLVLQLPEKQIIEADSAPENSTSSEQTNALKRKEFSELNFLSFLDSASILTDETDSIYTKTDQLDKQLTADVPKKVVKTDNKQKITDSTRNIEIAALPSKVAAAKHDLTSPDIALPELDVVNDNEVHEVSNSETTRPQTADDTEKTAVIGYDEIMPRRAGVNANPQPLGGTDLFNSYLDNNTRYPVGVENPQRETLRIQFKVSLTGDPKDINVSRAPANEAFTREAIRLIKDGPRWSPAIKNGIPVEAEVSLRITFKP